MHNLPDDDGYAWPGWVDDDEECEDPIVWRTAQARPLVEV